ncbi:MAG: 3-phosphoglycerate dehydrogenase [Acholeplasmataceae bacterium]|nr:3-phosphoglycerate dehydrogenase [Acholeplasmataceae bacterium]
MHKIHCLNNISKVGLDTLPSDYQLTDHIHDAQAILVRSQAMHDILLPSGVLAVGRAGAGVNNIPLEKYADAGVVVFNTPGANANAVKELTIAGMFLAARDIYGGIKWITENKHDVEISKTVEKVKSQFGGTEIFGKTIGIIGLGAIGNLILKACHALGMKIVVNERNMHLINVNDYPSDVLFTETKEELYPLCDYISLNLPLIPETKGMINETVLNQMKDGVVILNFARDALVNDNDLEKALNTRKVFKYVTDFPNHRTVNMEHVIAIPHLGASTEEAEDNCAIMAIDQIRNYIERGSIRNSVNYPNLFISRNIKMVRLQVLFKISEEDLNPFVEHIKSISKNHTHIDFAYRNRFGYMVLDFDQHIDDHLIENIMENHAVIRVIKIQK